MRRAIPVLTLVAALMSIPLAALCSVPATLCDGLAAGPDDPLRIAAPVPLEAMDIVGAVAACRAAVDADPDEARLRYQYGRALLAAGRVSEARKVWRSATLRGYPAAFYDLGIEHLRADSPLLGEGAAEAYRLFLGAAERDHGLAQEAVGLAHETGRGTTQSDREAARWYARAVANGNASARYQLARLYGDGRGVVFNVELARRLFRQAAEAGVTDPFGGPGALYLDGPRAARAAGAARFLSAEFDLSGANAADLYEFGRLLSLGLGLPVDKPGAVESWRRAAARGFDEAEYALGTAYLHGDGVDRDLDQARHHLANAAEAGVVKAIYPLGRMHELGLGGEADHSSARAWYERAAAAGNARGILGLGGLYETGSGVARHPMLAASLYRQAAQAGDTLAQRSLARLLAGGPVREDPRPLAWLRIAAALGDPGASSEARALAARSSPRTRAAAEAAANAWIAAYRGRTGAIPGALLDTESAKPQ